MIVNYKSSLKLFFVLTLLITATITAANFVIDPYQQYRKSKFYPVMFMNGTERYLNAGLAKNYPYDSVVIGSSMTQNFIISEVAENLNFPNPIKLTTSGGNIFEEATILNTAVATGKVKKVLFGIDIMALPEAEYGSQLPLFLYDDNIFNDHKYLFNLDTFKRSALYPIIPLLVSKDHPRRSYNLMYQWQHLFDESYFKTERVVAIWRSIEENNNNSDNVDMLQHIGDESGSYANTERQSLSNMKLNFDNLVLPILRQQQDVEFIFFFPPYSSLAYKVLENDNKLSDFIEIKKHIARRFSEFPNVTLYDFQIAKEITYDLGNYMDLSHYHQKINTWILEQIKNDEYRINTGNMDSHTQELLKQTTDFNLSDLSKHN